MMLCIKYFFLFGFCYDKTFQLEAPTYTHIIIVVLSSEKIRDYNKICRDVKDLDAKIKFAGVINERGRLVAGGMKQGIQPLESQRDDEMLFMELALRVKIRQEFDRQLGLVNFALASRRKFLEISVPAGLEHILYVMAEPDADYAVLPAKILDILNKQ